MYFKESGVAQSVYGIRSGPLRKSIWIPVRGKKFYSSPNFQTGCGTYPASYSEGTDDPFSEIKWPEREVSHAPQSSAAANNTKYMKLKFIPP